MVSPNAFRRIFWIFDLVCIGFAFILAYAFLPWLHQTLQPYNLPGLPFLDALKISSDPLIIRPPISNFGWIFLITCPASILMLDIFGNHNPLLEQSRTRIVLGSLMAPFIGISLAISILFALKNPSWSRLFIFSFAGFSSIGFSLYRLILRQYFLLRQKAGRYALNLALIGEPSGIEWVSNYLAVNFPSSIYKIYGYYLISPYDEAFTTSYNHIRNLGNIDCLGDLLVSEPIHQMIVIYPTSGGTWLKQVIQSCDYFRVALHIIPESLLQGTTKDLQIIYRSEILKLPAVTLMPRNWNSESVFVKRLIDIFVSAGLLMLLMPLFVVVALLIKITTPHLPIFYRWKVVGKNGAEFTGYKFTTMDADADERKDSLSARNEMSGPVFKIKDDPRVTPIGRYLRKFSINELPQLWSVLKGDMSLVGPRPAFRHELERYELWHKRKLSVRPGITCLWQVRGRNKISDFDDWVRMDLEYIDNWSLWLDFKILFWTGLAVLGGTGW
jgi:exopolysaccharide biosynthesis polyprenyl glycosylphosphotransferase